MTDNAFDRRRFAHFHHITKERFIELQGLINENAPNIENNNFTRRHGLQSKPGVLSSLLRDRHLQTPQDAYHAVAGKIQRLLECTLNLLNDSGKKQLLEYWRCFEKPSIWHRLPNPVTHIKSFMFADMLQLAILMPFILRRFLTPKDIISKNLEALCNRLSSYNNRRCSATQVINTVISSWVIVAEFAAQCFKTVLTTHDLNRLQDILVEERNILLKVRFIRCNCNEDSFIINFLIIL